MTKHNITLYVVEEDKSLLQEIDNKSMQKKKTF